MKAIPKKPENSKENTMLLTTSQMSNPEPAVTIPNGYMTQTAEL